MPSPCFPEKVSMQCLTPLMIPHLFLFSAKTTKDRREELTGNNLWQGPDSKPFSPWTTSQGASFLCLPRELFVLCMLGAQVMGKDLDAQCLLVESG